MTEELECPAAPKRRGGGPKTPEGIKRASADSLMPNGRRTKVLLPEELVGTFEAYKAELERDLTPESLRERWLVREMALGMARLDRCADLSVGDLVRCQDIAVFDWDDYRKSLAEALGKKLAKDPSRVAHELEQTRHGADWIIARWEGFRSALAATGSCDDELRRLACDLMGVPPEVRQGDDKVPPAADVSGLSALAEREIARLRGRQEFVLNGRDETWRSMAMAGMPFDEDAGTARLRRYESGIRRALGRAEAELLRLRAEAAGGEPRSAGGLPPLVPEMSGAAVKYQVERVIGSTYIPASTPTQDETPPDDETDVEDEVEVKVPAPPVASAPEAAPGGERPIAAAPVVVRPAGIFPASASARTAAHCSAAPRNRFEQRAAKSQARKAARHAAKGR